MWGPEGCAPGARAPSWPGIRSGCQDTVVGFAAARTRPSPRPSAAALAGASLQQRPMSPTFMIVSS